ncbi:MAG: GNAT family N-acetyltransferase [Fimbriiglobus sp.]
MATEPQLYYFCKPTETITNTIPVEFLTAAEFLTDEPACKMLWELIDTQFNTRSKFLAIWKTVSYVATHRDSEGTLDGFLLVTAPVNWQIDYVVVRPDARGQGIAGALVKTAISQAYMHKVPYVMLTSKESLRPLYESCGFEVIRSHVAV